MPTPIEVRQPPLIRVRDLIAQLQACDPDAVVVMSSDAEGNEYAPLSPHMDRDSAFEYQDPERPWFGLRVGPSTLSPEADLAALGLRDKDVIVEGQKCVCLWPT